MDCPALHALAAFVSDERDDPALATHAAGCPRCRREIARLRTSTLASSNTALLSTMEATSELAAAPRRYSMRLLPRGASLGRYVVVDLLGAGGMGVVYAAFDPELDRKVAVKLLHASFAARPADAGDRLLAEAKAMAKLSHPNVIAVHDVGVVDGQLFVAMELVDGMTLRQWLETPRAPELVRARLVDAGRGLAAAHAVGLVHRDFKPDNVLLGRDGRVRVSDFGIARPPTEDADDVAGTPHYMAPEATAGIVDPRSDQFSFCVTLHEALAGARARHPAEIAPKLPADVRKVLGRGLTPDPVARYPSMDALLAELAPRRRGRAYVLAGGVAVAGAAIAVALVSRAHELQVCASGAREIAAVWHAGAAAEVRAVFAGDATAGDALTRTSSALDLWTRQWTDEHAATCRATRIEATQSDELLDLRMACLRARALAVGALVQRLRDRDARALAYAVPTIHAVGDLSRCRGDRQALRMFASVTDPVLAREIDGLRRELADVEAGYATGHGKAIVDRALALVARAETLGAWVVVAPARFYAGIARAQLGDFGAAEALLRQAMLDADRAGDDLTRMRAQLALAQVLSSRSQPARAAELLAPAEATAARLGDRVADRSELLVERARIAFVQGRYAEAVTLSRQATDLVDGEPNLPIAWHRAHHMLATSLDATGDIQAALAEYTRTVEQLEAHFGRDSPLVAAPLAMRGALAARFERTEHALRDLQRAIAILDQALGADAIATAVWRAEVARLRADDQDLATARAELARGLRLLGTSSRIEHVALSMQLGDLEMAQGAAAAALPAYDAAVMHLERIHGPDHPALSEGHARRANALRSLGRLDEAIASFERALAVDGHGDGSDELAFHLASTQQAGGLLEAARASYTRCLDLATPRSQPGLTAECQEQLARLVDATDRPRAIELARKAHATQVEGGDTDAATRLARWLAARGVKP